MSMISKLVEELIDNADLYTKELHDLMYRAAETIVTLSEKARGQEWIPCEERTPKLGQKVLASTKKTVFTQVFKGYYEDPTRWNWEHNSIKKIEAWMPLPEPYMKGADDEDSNMGHSDM